jgi:hypothetical protein
MKEGISGLKRPIMKCAIFCVFNEWVEREFSFGVVLLRELRCCRDFWKEFFGIFDKNEREKKCFKFKKLLKIKNLNSQLQKYF